MMQKNLQIKQYTLDGELVAVYTSIKEACLKSDISSNSIRMALKSASITAGRYIWAYDHEEAQIKIKIRKLLDETDRTGKVTVKLDSLEELEVLKVRLKKRPKTKIQTRLLDDGRIWVKLWKEDRRSNRLPEEPTYLKKKPKWWICYKVDNLGYRYAIDFGRGDTPKEAIKSFKRSRGLSNLKHEVVYIDRDYYKVLSYLLSYGGRKEQKDE